ncbi:hypothetical protein E2986_10348 [Frieseomelitta varia]|uniref:Uncharacterized protein n=1 Tax=Frieseomelitta varia TaxID=561572 RepID=A0A833VV08_9HYME|nr:hypothetical protein E2986_10348 [Frieseomelitta varia]
MAEKGSTLPQYVAAAAGTRLKKKKKIVYGICALFNYCSIVLNRYQTVEPNRLHRLPTCIVIIFLALLHPIINGTECCDFSKSVLCRVRSFARMDESGVTKPGEYFGRQSPRQKNHRRRELLDRLLDLRGSDYWQLRSWIFGGKVVLFFYLSNRVQY